MCRFHLLSSPLLTWGFGQNRVFLETWLCWQVSGKEQGNRRAIVVSVWDASPPLPMELCLVQLRAQGYPPSAPSFTAALGTGRPSYLYLVAAALVCSQFGP